MLVVKIFSESKGLITNNTMTCKCAKIVFSLRLLTLYTLLKIHVKLPPFIKPLICSVLD